MTIASTTNRIDAVGNGTADTYPYTFRIFANTDLRVTVRDTDDVETTLTLTTDYTVTGVGAAAGGNVVLVDADQAWLDADGDLKSGYTITIRRVVDITQETDIRNQGSFFPEAHENALDHAIMVDQQQQDEIDRSVKLAETVEPDTFSPTLPADIADSAGKVLLVNSDGDGFAPASEWPDGADIAAAGANATAAAASAASAAADAAATLFRWGGAPGGTADAITLTPTPALTSYTSGIRYVFVAGGTNTGTVTINISGLGAQAVRANTGAVLTAGQIVSGTLYTITYDGTNFRLTDPTVATFSIVVDEFSGDGSDTTFTLSRDPGAENNILVIVDGVEVLVKDRSLSGTTLTFLSAPPVGTNNINVFHMGVAVAVGTPGDGTITTPKLGDDAVTFAKMQNIATSRILGRTTASSGDVEELTAGNGLALTGGSLSADIATQAEVEAAASATKLVPASLVKNHPGVAKAWIMITFPGGTATAAAAYNCTIGTDHGTGDVTVNFTVAFSSATYAAIGTVLGVIASDVANAIVISQAAGSCRVAAQSLDATHAGSDSTMYWAFFGDQ